MFPRRERLMSVEMEPMFHEQAVSIEKFVDAQSVNLEQSATEWGKAGAALRWICQDEQLGSAFVKGVECSLESANFSVTPGRVQQTADILRRDLTTYMHAAARTQAAKPESMFGDTMGILDALKGAPHASVVSIIKRKDFPKVRLTQRYGDMVMAMRQADEIGDSVLHALCRDYIKTPQQLAELHQLYKDEAETVHPLLSELRNIITVDWYRQNPEKSVLRTHIHSLTEDATQHVEPFCEAVALGRRAAVVRTMSQYALASSGLLEPSDKDIFKQLLSTRHAWSSVPDLQDAFDQYVAQANQSIEASIAQIAGPENRKNVRLERTPEEMLALTQSMRVEGSANVVESRNGQRNRRKRQGAAQLGISSASEIIRQLEHKETVEERPVASLKPVSGRGYELQHIDRLSEEALVEHFKLGGEAAKHMLSAVEHLRQPIHALSGTRKMVNTDIRFAGKRYGLWRFAPNAAPGLRIDPAYRYYRISYAIIDGALAIHGIMSHDDFDKAYKS